jgi:hypothetical protein
MSNRWKKSKKGKPEKKRGWMTWDEFRREYERGRVGPEFQRSGCQTTGEVYVRPITGRFKNKSKEELRQMVDDICQIFVRAGHPPVLDPSQPLWSQAEFLDNMLEFEMNPPCGCDSEIKDVIKTA